MPNDLFGYSFSPDLADKFRSSLNSPTGQSSGQLPGQIGAALQVLSLHLPSILGGSPIAPDTLLRPNRSASPDAAVRAQTTGIPTTPMQGPTGFGQQMGGGMTPSSMTSPPSMMTPPRSVMSSLPDMGPGTPSPPPNPTITFGGPKVSAPTNTSPIGPSAGGGAGGGNAGLLAMLNQALRGGRGV